MGGRVLKALGKSATHFIWANGKLRNLLKASDLGLQIVSPLWLKACTEQGKAVEEEEFRPSDFAEKLRMARNQFAPAEQIKKRAADQLTIVESMGNNATEPVVPKTEA